MPKGLLRYRNDGNFANPARRELAAKPEDWPWATSGTADPSFTGQNSDTVSSLYDFTFRRLSPTQGRWISPDPAGLAAVDPTNPQTWNRYAYVANNPLSFIDPLGLQVDGPHQCSVDGDPCGGGGTPVSSIDEFDLMQLSAVGDYEYGNWEGYYPIGTVSGADYSATSAIVEEQWGWGYVQLGLAGLDALPDGASFSPPSGTGAGGAPNNGNNCSVLDPNCKPMGPVQKYGTFLLCEYNITMADVTDASPASYGALAAGATGVKQMISFLNGVGKGVPVINEIAALYDVTMMNIEAVKSNQACTAAVYGH